MAFFRSLRCGLVLGLLVLTFAWPAQADERILDFASNVQVGRNGTLTVTETIRVQAEGQQIKRGIFRDIPLTAEGADGRTYRVGFKLLSVLQDGRPAPYSQRENGSGVRIYVGEKDVFLQEGAYTYTFKYEIDRQIRFFETHDELYWNATGLEWAFPIDEAIARVVLPEGGRAEKWTAFTGTYGETGERYEANSQKGGSEIVFRTTAPLPPYAGLTVVVSMPKGTVLPPSEAERIGYFLSDYSSALIGAGGVILVLVYYLVAWWMVGRDPPRGVVFPRFQPPEGISPALSRYIAQRGFADGGWIALSAACLNLAVKNRLKIEDNSGVATLSLFEQNAAHSPSGAGLPRGEAAVERWLVGRNGPVALSKANGLSIKALGTKFRNAIENENRNVFFRSNWAYLVPGGLLSLITIVALFAFGQMQPGEEGFVIIFLAFSVFASVTALQVGKAAFRKVGIQWRLALVFLLFALAVAAVSFGAWHVSGGVDNLPVLPLIAAVLVALNLLFFFLIGAPTALGRKALDEIEGLEMYLSVAEKERLNMKDAPDMSTAHFEKLLPYAVALGVERPWATAFESWLAAAAGASLAASYHPSWYSGDGFSSARISDNIANTAHSMSGSFQSSLPVPKSSSSGFSGSSGGFSGGGGGGGGGGGW
ncbi:DUF2207 domain-containing protein [Roseibium aggregatum]|uniref:DUF2207 domain-containing protein n=1 Tax=Roseibium aggregatum TaxID=187304 RepID=A0A939J2J9_9HYPH|nr:DUF2207 domain-containing protein [Roseibium aggregatum]MBN9669180.1 DUF2207 domain-containing protein [Roseibium aggregatum]